MQMRVQKKKHLPIECLQVTIIIYSVYMTNGYDFLSLTLFPQQSSALTTFPNLNQCRVLFKGGSKLISFYKILQLPPPHPCSRKLRKSQPNTQSSIRKESLKMNFLFHFQVSKIFYQLFLSDILVNDCCIKVKLDTKI